MRQIKPPTPINILIDLIEDRYTTHHTQSTASKEGFISIEGDILALQHYTFMLGLRDSEVHPDNREKVLAEALWKTLKNAWPAGTFLMWRSPPNLQTGLSADVEPITALVLRIGSFTPPVEGTHKKEGADVPIL
jgi:hypothetical protein